MSLAIQNTSWDTNFTLLFAIYFDVFVDNKEKVYKQIELIYMVDHVWTLASDTI